MLGTMCVILITARQTQPVTTRLKIHHRSGGFSRECPGARPEKIFHGRRKRLKLSWSKFERKGSSFAEKKEVERTCKFSHKILEKKKEDIETSGKVYAGVGSGEEANDRRRGRRDFQSRGAPLRLFLNLPQSRRKKNS
jgi:hypothetical protein